MPDDRSNTATSHPLSEPPASPGGVDLEVPLGFIDCLQSTQTRQQVVQCFTDWAGRLNVAEHMSIALQDAPDSCTLHEVWDNGPRVKKTMYLVNESAVGLVMREQAALKLDDLSSHTSPDAIALSHRGIATWALAPILRSGRCFGTIAAGGTDAAVSDGTISNLEVIGRCLATQFLLIEQIDDLVRAATTDPLTSVGNRRRFNDGAGLLWKAWKDGGPTFSLISVDIDHFKSVNDQFGHDVGDDVIRITAERLVNCVRAEDEVIRMGGEEFCVLLTEADLTAAGALAERCRLALCEHPFSSGELALDVTASFGVAEVGPTDYSFSTLTRRLDQALYTAKSKGRNQVELSIPEPEDDIFFLTA